MPDHFQMQPFVGTFIRNLLLISECFHWLCFNRKYFIWYILRNITWNEILKTSKQIKKNYLCFGLVLNQIYQLCSWAARICRRLFSKRCTFEYNFTSQKKLCLVIFFIHIIQLSLFNNEYLPIADKKVIFTIEKGDLNYVNKKIGVVWILK